MQVESDQPFKLALVRWVVDGAGRSRLAPPIPLVGAFMLQPPGEMQARPAQIVAARSEQAPSYVNCPAGVGLSRAGGFNFTFSLQLDTRSKTPTLTLDGRCKGTSGRPLDAGANYSIAVWGGLGSAMPRASAQGHALRLQPWHAPPEAARPPVQRPSCPDGDAGRMLVVTYADPQWIKNGKADNLLRSFANERNARLLLLGGQDLEDPYRSERGKTMRKASMLVQLHQLLSKCPPTSACVLFSDADVVWLPGFWQRLRAACDDWEHAFPLGDVVVSAEMGSWPPQYDPIYRKLGRGYLRGINSGIFFGRWHHVRQAVKAVIEQYGVAAEEIARMHRLPQQLLPYVYHMHDQESWGMQYARSSSAASGDGEPRITLDYNASIFLCIFGLPQGQDGTLRRVIRATPGSVHFKPTGTRPIALHYNGGAQHVREVRGTPEMAPAALLSDLPNLAFHDATNASCLRVLRAVTLLDQDLREISNSADVLCKRGYPPL